MTVTIYKSTDANAPSLPANSAGGQAWFMNLLKACLVDGYTGKAGAGWTVDYHDTTTGKERIALSNGNGIIEFVCWDSAYIGMMIWDSITAPGVGAIRADAFADVMSDGVNGFKHQCRQLPGTSSESIPSIHSGNFNNAATAWTIYANDKSAWIRFHYPYGNSAADAGDTLSYAYALHPVVFFGAVKGPDLGRDDLGNFSIIYGQHSSASSVPNWSGQENAIYAISLRTPMATIPDYVANGSVFDYARPSIEFEDLNPYSSLRRFSPVFIYYQGNDAPKPSGVPANYGKYHYAQLPGVVYLANSDSSYGGFWARYSQYASMSWNQQPITIGGLNLMPFGFAASSGDGAALTDNPAWWP